MKPYAFLAAAAFSALAAAAQINSPANSGDMLRAGTFFAAGDNEAALDQLRQLDPAALDADEALAAAWLEARTLYGAAAYGRARAAFAAFAERYPASPLRTLCRKYMADCLFAAGDYAAALKEYSAVDTDGLDAVRAAELHYRSGFCALEAGDTTRARAEFAMATAGGDYGSAARFHMAAIDYSRGDYASAKALLRQVDTSRAPGDMADYYLASIDLADGNYAQAAATARALMRRRTLDPAAEAQMHRVAGEGLFRSGERAEGLRELRAYLAAVDEPAPEACYFAGLGEYDDGNYAAAVDLLDKATASDDASVVQSAYLYIGQALHHRGDDAAAILAFDKAVKTDGADPSVREAAYYNYAVARSAGAEVPFASAADIFEDFLRLYPAGVYSDRVRGYLADGYMADRNYARALESLDGIASPGPRTRAAKLRLLYLLANDEIAAGELASARRHLDTARSYADADAATAAEATLLRGRLAAAEGRNSDAATEYRRYLAGKGSRPNATVTRYGLGYALMAEGDYAGARSAFLQIENDRTLTPAQRADVLNRLGDIAYTDHDFEGAVALFSRAYDASPASGDYASFNGARMLGFARNYEGKLRAIDVFMNEFPQSVLIPDALLERTQALISLGRNAEAVDTYRRLTETYAGTPQGRRGYLEMAMTLLDMGRRDEAMAAYRDVISNYPTSEEALQASGLLKNLYAADGHGDRYLEFMAGVENAPEVSADDTERLTFESALAANKRTGDTAALRSYLDRFPDAPHAPEALLVVAQAEYDADRIPEALELFRTLETKAPNSTVATDARLGIMRSARDMGDYALAGSTAEAIINSSAAPAALSEAVYTRGIALEADGDTAGAIELWQSQAADTKNIFGAKSAYRAAEALFESGQTDKALAAVQAFTGSGSPHSYWVARGFILQSDIYRKLGKEFEAREYLEALRDNYPGTETDIFSLIDSRLNPQPEKE